MNRPTHCRTPRLHRLALVLATMTLAACGSSDTPPAPAADSDGGMAGGNPPAAIDMRCDNAPYPSAEWTQCEQANFARTGEGPAESAAPDFVAVWQPRGLANQQAFNDRALADPSWLGGSSGNTPVTPLCATWNQQCTGDPFRYPDGAGPDGQAFYDSEAEVTPVVFYDDGCARLSGRVWLPRGAANPLPGIVIQNGSVQAPETLYWWAAQALVRAGYAVMSFDPRGQGRSDQQTPDGQQGSNANQAVFWTGLVNAIDFFRSSPAAPYPHNDSCTGTYPTEVTPFNPIHASIDPGRLGIAGHSLGGIGVSVVQSYDAPGADPWPGLMDASNPVDVIVAWDGLYTEGSEGAGNASGNAGTNAPTEGIPTVVPRVPALGQNGEYGLTPVAFTEPPDPDRTTYNFRQWQAAGQPVIEQTIAGSTHYEWSLLPTFPTSSWCPDPASGQCSDGWGNPFAEHYTVAWFDRWLKQPGEPGFDDADARLLDDDGPQGRLKYSFRYRSARDFADRSGNRHACEDIRAGC